MSDQEVVIVSIDLSGEITVKTEGFEGASCINAIKDLEEGLGKVKKVELTPEFHKKPLQNSSKNVIRRKQ